MERKITHYVVKPEHYEHFEKFTGYDPSIKTITPNDRIDRETIQDLAAAKVLDLWCTPVYEKPRVKGWYNVYDLSLSGPYKTKEQAITYSHNNPACRGQTLIDQEIE